MALPMQRQLPTLDRAQSHGQAGRFGERALVFQVNLGMAQGIDEPSVAGA
jgi:hypothetical protein